MEWHTAESATIRQFLDINLTLSEPAVLLTLMIIAGVNESSPIYIGSTRPCCG
jgi:hypothetical protein